MEFIKTVIEDSNFDLAINKVITNNGASGIDKMGAKDFKTFISKNRKFVIDSIYNGTYNPQVVKRVDIPKPNGGVRHLGIPTYLDRTVQQALANKLSELYEPLFSDNSFGFRPNRSCHKAMFKAIDYLNEGYEWIVDLDIEKFFDRVNQDKLTSIIREQMNDAKTLRLISKFLKAGVMVDGVVQPTEEGMPQGGNLSPVLSNIYLNKLDKELESRGLRFVRYADDCVIFVKSELSANRVLKSITSWIERKLFLKVNATKSKVSKPTKTDYLGFTFTFYNGRWGCKPSDKKKRDLIHKIKIRTIRKKCAAKSFYVTVEAINNLLRGWINYFRIGYMKQFLADKIGKLVRDRLRCILVKQWKKAAKIERELTKYAKKYGYWVRKVNLKSKVFRVDDEKLFAMANARKGLYEKTTGKGYRYILGKKFFSESIPDKDKNKKSHPGLVDPLEYYLKHKLIY